MVLCRLALCKSLRYLFLHIRLQFELLEQALLLHYLLQMFDLLPMEGLHRLKSFRLHLEQLLSLLRSFQFEV